LNFLIVSGEAATRGSEGSISLATAIFIGPPAAREARAMSAAVLLKKDATPIDGALRDQVRSGKSPSGSE
jgi:hypothetical protein